MKRAGLLRALLVPTLVVGLLTPIAAQPASALAMRTITFAKTSVDGGAGSVTVTDGTTTAVCGETCTSATWSFPRLSVLRFTQTARASDSNFTRWTVGGSTTTCPATGSSATCSFTLSADTTVAATFSLNVFSVLVSRTLSGAATTVAGIVAATSTSTPRPTGSAQINCGAVCSANYLQGATVTLTATPASNAYAFVGWSGTGSAAACTGTGTCAFSITLAGGASTVTARFLPTYALNVTKATGTGIGSGTVTSTSSPSQANQIDCGATCSRLFNQGTTVTLSATPAAGSAFGSWSGCTSASGTVCTVLMDNVKNVTVTFLLTYALTVVRSGNGSGTVTAASSPTQPAQINCGSTCTVPYSHGMAVTLTAAPSVGSVFTSWGGVTCSQGIQTGTSCTVSMTQAQNATATFTLTTHSLSVATNGGNATGGSVTATGIACPGDCTEVLNWGTVVSLTAVPGTGMNFTGWTGCASTGALTCSVTITTATSVVASFTWQRNPLALTVSGSGTGTVTSGEATPTLNCTDDCSVTYDYPTTVTLTAVAAAGSRFMGWTGDCSGTGTCVVAMSQARSVTATFTKTYVLQVTLPASNGTGSVSSTSAPSQPGQIACGVTCTQAFLENAAVTITAAPGTGSYVIWSGCTSTSGNTCQVTMSEAKTVTATFTLYRYPLAVAFSGAGSGTVTGSVGGLSCTDDCSVDYDHFTVVTLSATSDAGSRFMGWSGEGCSGIGTCQVTMVQSRSVTATFAREFELTVTRPASNGSGSVSSTVDAGHQQVAQISCGSTCSQSFLENAVVTLTAAPTTGSYVTWGGACLGVAGNTCDVTVTEALTVSATFTLTRHALDVTVSGKGSVSSTSTPSESNQIDCDTSLGADCGGEYDYGTSVTLTAHPATGWETTWGDACSGVAGDECTGISMTLARSVTATFTRIRYDLTADIAGNGTGKVTSSSDPGQTNEIDCTSDCTVRFPYETVVTLTATPDSDSSFFAGWSANCTPLADAPNMCETTVLLAETVVATFTLITRTVTVGFTGAGSGSVVSDEPTPEIDCASSGAPCSAGYDHFSTPTLTATADQGSRFMGWTGEDCSGTAACDLTMTADRSVTADFAEDFLVSVDPDGNGSGSVASSVDDLHPQAAQIDCGSACGVRFLDGATVKLTAQPDTGSYVTWGGACTGMRIVTCDIDIDGADQSVTATFTLERYALTVSKQGNGTGTVTSTSAPSQVTQIGCGDTCSATYDYGTVVTLTPLAAPGSTFTGWQGGACTGTGPCNVTIADVTEVKAYFMVLRTLTVTRTGNGASYGRIVSTPAGIDCQAATCTATFVDGTALSLAASTATGATFTSWGGDKCSGSTVTPCTFTIIADTAVSAAFTLNIHTITLNIAGTGAGSVAISTGPTSTCTSGTCQLTFDYGTAVTFTETPSSTSPLSTFGGWTGACIQSRTTCNITVNGDTTLTATFTKVVYSLALTKTRLGGGNGTVTVDGGAVGGTCGPSCSSGSWTYDPGTVVTLTQVAADDGVSYFDSWSGATCSEGTQSGAVCTVTMSQAFNVTATFAAYQSLDVSIGGAGVGSVMGGTADGPAIDCPGTACAGSYRYGSVVSLYPLEGQDSVFGNWLGACTGSAVCTVTMDGSKSVTAMFNLMPMSVTVIKQSQDGGGGTVTSAPAGINCGARCSTQTSSFPYSVQFSITATPDANSYFVRWEGATCEAGSTSTPSGGTCYLTPFTPLSLTAVFGTPTLYLTKVYASAGASGSVSSSPSGISCATKCMSADGTYTLGRVVTLTAKAANGSVFSGWSGACSGLSTCVVTMQGLAYVTATFGSAVNLNLTVLGSGTVTSSPSGINCPTTCSTSAFGAGTVVVLTAVASAGSVLTSWNGATCTEGTQSGTTCTFTLVASTTVTASFGPAP